MKPKDVERLYDASVSYWIRRADTGWIRQFVTDELAPLVDEIVEREVAKAETCVRVLEHRRDCPKCKGAGTISLLALCLRGRELEMAMKCCQGKEEE